MRTELNCGKGVAAGAVRVAILALFSAIFGGVTGSVLALFIGLETAHIIAAYPVGGILAVVLSACLGCFRADPQHTTR